DRIGAAVYHPRRPTELCGPARSPPPGSVGGLIEELLLSSDPAHASTWVFPEPIEQPRDGGLRLARTRRQHPHPSREAIGIRSLPGARLVGDDLVLVQRMRGVGANTDEESRLGSAGGPRGAGGLVRLDLVSADEVLSTVRLGVVRPVPVSKEGDPLLRGGE